MRVKLVGRGAVGNLSEDDIVDLVVLAGVREFQERRRNPTESVLHWAKFVYSVAEDLDLDVTRSWYKMGQYVWSNRLSLDRVYQLNGTLISEKYPPAESTINLALTNAKTLFQDIREAARNRFAMFWRTTSELRRDIYENEAPEPFSALYLTELDLEEYCDKIIESQNYAVLYHAYSRDMSRCTNQLHLSLRKAGIRKDCAEAVIDYTSLMELMVVKYGMVGSPSQDWVKSWFDGFADTFDLYKDKVWAFPAAQLTVMSVKRGQSEQVKSDMLRKMDDVGLFSQEIVRSRRIMLMEKGLVPTPEELDSHLEKNTDLRISDLNDLHQAMMLYLSQG